MHRPPPHHQVFLGDFGTAWRLVDEDGIPLRLGSRNELAERRAGVGRHKAPEVRGRARADGHPLMRAVYGKAGGFSVGIAMYDVRPRRLPSCTQLPAACLERPLSLPCVPSTFAARTLPVPRAVPAFAAKRLPLPCASSACAAKRLPLPCASSACVAKRLPCALCFPCLCTVLSFSCVASACLCPVLPVSLHCAFFCLCGEDTASVCFPCAAEPSPSRSSGCLRTGTSSTASAGHTSRRSGGRSAGSHRPTRRTRSTAGGSRGGCTRPWSCRGCRRGCRVGWGR